MDSLGWVPYLFRNSPGCPKHPGGVHATFRHPIGLPRSVDESQLDISLDIPSVRANIQLVERFILDVDRLVGLGDDVLDRVMISVTEVVNNAIIHGNKADPAKMVHVRCACYADRIAFTVQDEGGGFDPDTLPDPREERNLLREGGRGILIIRAMMDDVGFERNERGMCVSLTTRRQRRDIPTAD